MNADILRHFFRIMRLLFFTLLAFEVCGAQPWTPDVLLIRKLEAEIKVNDMPALYSQSYLPAIARYSRYYFGYKAGDHRMISGEFILPFGTRMKPAGIYIVHDENEFPTIFDGGCAVMRVVFDVEANHVVSLKCNGLA